MNVHSVDAVDALDLPFNRREKQPAVGTDSPSDTNWYCAAPACGAHQTLPTNQMPDGRGKEANQMLTNRAGSTLDFLHWYWRQRHPTADSLRACRSAESVTYVGCERTCGLRRRGGFVFTCQGFAYITSDDCRRRECCGALSTFQGSLRSRLRRRLLRFLWLGWRRFLDPRSELI